MRFADRLKALLAMAPLAVSAAVFAQTQPNLIFILSDDHGVDAIEGEHWSNELNARTPNLAAWSSQGRVFTNTRVNPNCSPTRAAILTGRDALQTGVNGVIAEFAPNPDRDKLSLQTHERTIAEVLQDCGYYTILIDKYHVGFSEELGQRPLQQGFDVHYGWRDYFLLDDPDAIGDEHIVRMTNFAIDAVNNRPDPNQPYALFYMTIDPHRRTTDSEGLLWWRIDPQLAPQTSGQGIATNSTRHRSVIEGMDTEMGRLLREISVVDVNRTFQPSSNTVVFFTGDNGTDPLVCGFGPGNAKNTPYEGGVHVPSFVFGLNVPSDGAADPRLISHVDFFETLADLAGATVEQRGDAPRRSISFADAIGWGDLDNPQEREFSLLSYGVPQEQMHLVAFTDGAYKIVGAAGGTDLEPLVNDEFYDLINDPLEEHDLVQEGMTLEELNRYFQMRDAIVDYWSTSVSEPFQPEDFRISVSHEVDNYRLIVIVDGGQLLPPSNDEFYDLVADPDTENNLVVSGMNAAQEAAYDSMRAALISDLQSGAVGPDTMVVDLMATDTLVLSSDRYVGQGALTIGHRHPGSANHEELRGYIRFDIASLDDLLPQGFTIDDVVAAQIIIGFSRDSQAADESDIGVIRAYPVTVQWVGRPRNYSRLENGWSPIELGTIDLPPHIISDPVADMRGLPLPVGTPVSFAHNEDLLNQVRQWHSQPSTNNGIALIADPLNDLGGDQSVDFLRTAGIRLTLRR